MTSGNLRIDELAPEIEVCAREACGPDLGAQDRADRLRELFVKVAAAVGVDIDAADFRAQTRPDYEAQGPIDSRVVIRTFERDTVASLLPRGLELAPQPIVHHRRHPVLFLFSDQQFGAWFGDMEYREMAIAIPFVQRTDLHVPHRGPFLYMPRMYLNAKRPRVLGNRLYGFEKLDAKIEKTESTYVVEELDGDEVARLEYKADGDWVEPAALPNFEKVRRMFDLPTISQGTRIYNQDAWSDRGSEGFFLGTNIRYHFDEPETRIQPLHSTLTIDAELTPRGLRTDPYRSKSLAEAELGSFRMKVRQTVSLPDSPSDIEFPARKPDRPKKVVVLGGGAAACTAAFYLAQQKERYQVEMYTLGWRFGGKCAAGRSRGPHSERIEEHGLHAFVGFYENVFRTVREVYSTVGLPLSVGAEPYDHNKGEGPIAGAFYGKLGVGLMDRHGDDDAWHYFETGQRFDGRIPGLIPRSEADELPGVGQVLLAMIERVRVETDKMRALTEDTEETSSRQTRENTWWRDVASWFREQLGVESEAGKLAELLDEFTDYQQQLLSERIGNMIKERAPLVRALGGALRGVRALVKTIYADEVDEDRQVWFTWSNLDLILTVAIGIIESATVHLDDLDDTDFRTWLLEHGLDEDNAEIAAVTMVYNTLFANERSREGRGSNPTKPDNLACGVALRWFLLLGFGFKGYPAYDFKWSCPQTVFTPMYEALRKLDVKIHFFHEVTELQVEGTTDATRKLTGVRMRQQARVKAGSEEYRPFAPTRRRRDLPGHDAWPVQPLWSQLHDDDAKALQDGGIDLENAWSGWQGVGEVTLEQGKDFDLCVLGISLGALRELAKPLYDPREPTASKAWTTMMSEIDVTPTASFQLWFDRPHQELYSGPKRELLTGYEQPWPSLGDLTHLIEWEGFPPGNTPKFLAYHTGAMLPVHPFDEHPPSDRDYPKWQADKVTEDIKEWLEEFYQGLYDKVESWEDFLAALNAPEGTEGRARLDAQYFHAAFQPSNLYVLSQAGTIQHRLGQGESGYENLFLCGDWTRTSMNSGCVEAAVQSGMLASKVISNLPRFIWSPGF